MVIKIEQDYPAPVQQLCVYGDARDSIHQQSQGWPNYLKLGLTEAHIPALIQVLQSRSWEQEAEEPEEEESVAVWASIHAWRALGQLGAEAAIPELMRLIQESDESDRIPLSEDWIHEWIIEELPFVFGLIGPQALPPLQELVSKRLQDYRNTTPPDSYSFTTALDALQEIATGCRRFANVRLGVPLPPASEPAKLEILELLHTWLQPYAEQDPETNAWLITTFLGIQTSQPARPALPADAPVLKLIAEAFAAGRVDKQICGDWEDLQLELGLLTLEQLSPEKQKRVKEEQKRIQHYKKELAALRRQESSKKLLKTGFGASTKPLGKKKTHKKRR